MLLSIGSQRFRHDLAIDQQQRMRGDQPCERESREQVRRHLSRRPVWAEDAHGKATRWQGQRSNLAGLTKLLKNVMKAEE